MVAPVEAVRDPGRRPAEGEDPLNAIVRFCHVQAESAEGVLSGKRVAVKDSVAIAGIPLTCGSRILQGFVPAEDSVVADRILRAGGEVVAITNMDDLAFSGGGESSWYGPTLNPWDPGRTAGGSSGGSAAALFYDGIDVAVGGDQGGSIRAPASWCGVVGLKSDARPRALRRHHRHRPDLRPLRAARADDGRRGRPAPGDCGPERARSEAARRPHRGLPRRGVRTLRIRSRASAWGSSPRASRRAQAWSGRRRTRLSRPSSASAGSARRPSTYRCPSTSRRAGSRSSASSRA